MALLRTLEYAATFGMKVFFYPDEPSLSSDGVVHEGYIASYHGLQGIPWIAETVALSTQLLMVEETGIAAHFSQLSCKSSVELMRWAKDKGLPVTCDVAMHQLYLTDDNLEGFNAMAYVLPPLRSNTDQQALRRGLKDGTIDAICSHHEPLNSTAKAPFSESTPGISNFDTFMALACQLVSDEVLTLEQLVDKICLNPARIAGISIQYEDIGGAVVVDPNLKWQVTAETMQSSGKNTPSLINNCKGALWRLSLANLPRQDDDQQPSSVGQDPDIICHDDKLRPDNYKSSESIKAVAIYEVVKGIGALFGACALWLWHADLDHWLVRATDSWRQNFGHF